MLRQRISNNIGTSKPGRCVTMVMASNVAISLWQNRLAAKPRPQVRRAQQPRVWLVRFCKRHVFSNSSGARERVIAPATQVTWDFRRVPAMLFSPINGEGNLASIIDVGGVAITGTIHSG
jgi:hypothetical protein